MYNDVIANQNHFMTIPPFLNQSINSGMLFFDTSLSQVLIDPKTHVDPLIDMDDCSSSGDNDEDVKNYYKIYAEKLTRFKDNFSDTDYIIANYHEFFPHSIDSSTNLSFYDLMVKTRPF
jgi:hypothetical protein